jgi:hypothetical protein
MTGHLWEALYDGVMRVALDHECFQLRVFVLTAINLPILVLGRSLFTRYNLCSDMERTFGLLAQYRK